MAPLRHLALLVVLLLVLGGDAFAAGLLVPRDGSPPIAVKSHRVTAEIVNGLARTKVRQTFVNAGDRPLEAIYLFPLPEGAAITAVAMEVDGQRLEGLLAERKKARQIYDDIVRSRRDPALVEQIGRELFRLSVFPVMPMKDTVVEISYVEYLPLTGGEYHYVYPLATKEGEAVTEQDLTVEVILNSAVPFTGITSSTPGMQIIRKKPGLAICAMEETAAKLDTDVVVNAKVEVGEPTLSVATFASGDDGGYFAAVVTPPMAREEQILPRDVILVIDTSGSMRGEKIEQAKASALFLLSRLRPTDRVNVIRFASDVDGFADAPVLATPENLAMLRGFVSAFNAAGGTAIGDALLAALSAPGEEGRVSTVVFLTDGRPTVGTKDPVELVGIAKAAEDKGLKVFPFGVGPDVDGGLLRGIAHVARGRAEIFRPGGEVESRLNRFLLRTSSPVLSDVKFEVAGVVVRDVFPRPLPDAYLGEQLAIVGRYRGAGEAVVTVSANVAGSRASLSRTVSFPGEPGGPLAVRDLFIRMKLAWLEDQLRLRSGLGDDAYYAALDRGAYSTESEIVEEMIAVSLEGGVQCAYTSFIVLLPEDRARLNPRDAEAIGQALGKMKEARGFGGAGAYRGPGGEVPPGARDPKDPQPPAERPGNIPIPPSAGGMTTPPPPVPAGPSAGSAVGGGLGSAATPGGKVSSPRPTSFVDWIFWWSYERDSILEMRARRESTGASATSESLRAEVVAALRTTFDNGRQHPAVRGSALQALARIGGADARALLLGIVDPASTSEFTADALVGLALLPDGEDPEVAALLAKILADRSLPYALRVRAAIAIGLRGDADQACKTALATALDGAEPTVDVPIAAMIAFGLLGDADAVPLLSSWASGRLSSGRRVGDMERAWAVRCLGRIGGPEAQSTAEKALKERGYHSRRAAMVAIGSILPGLEEKGQLATAKRLARYLMKERDETARNLGDIALGRLGNAAVSERVLSVCEKVLVKVYEDGGKMVERPYAALALGLLAMPGPDGNVKPVEVRNRIADLLVEALRRMKGDRDALGALAVALGLLGDDRESTVELLTRTLEDRGHVRKLRGAAAMGLALIGGGAGRDEILSALEAREDRDLRIDTATAMGVIGGPGAGEALVRVFNDPRASQFVLGAAAVGLGRVGGEEEVKQLLVILEAKNAHGHYPDLTRSLAAVALGRLLTRGTERRLPRLSRDFLWRSTTPVLDELLSIL